MKADALVEWLEENTAPDDDVTIADNKLIVNGEEAELDINEA